MKSKLVKGAGKQLFEQIVAGIDLSRLPDEQAAYREADQRLTESYIKLCDLDGVIAEGDVVILATQSDLPKFNKTSVSVTVGKHLYGKQVEDAVVGKSVGDTFHCEVDGHEVMVTVTGAKRKVFPEPTDQMAAEQGLEGITTLQQYRNKVWDDKVNAVIGGIMTDVMAELEKHTVFGELAQEDYETLCRNDRDNLVQAFESMLKMPIDQVPKEKWRELLHRYDSLDEFCEARKEGMWKHLRDSLIFIDALGIETDETNDPMLGVVQLVNLNMTFGFKIKELLLNRRNK